MTVTVSGVVTVCMNSLVILKESESTKFIAVGCNRVETKIVSPKIYRWRMTMLLIQRDDIPEQLIPCIARKDYEIDSSQIHQLLSYLLRLNLQPPSKSYKVMVTLG